MRGIVALLLALVVTACEYAAAPMGPDPNLDATGAEQVFSTDRESYAPGATLVIRLRNPHQHGVGYNLCSSILERQAGGAWQISEVGNDRVCTMALWTLEPGRTATFNVQLDSRLPEGEYRFRTNLENLDARTSERVFTNTFRIIR